MSKKVLLAGSTGYLGKNILKILSENPNYEIIALARSPEKLSEFEQKIKKIKKAELTKPKTLTGICKNIDIVISTVGITKPKDNLTYMDVDYKGNLNLLKEAEKSGVDKFVFISVYKAHKMNFLKGAQAKNKFTDALKKSTVSELIIYPNGFFSDMENFFNMAKKGKVYLVGKGNYKINPIDGKDLAKEIVKTIATDKKHLEIGGPQIFSHNEIAKLAFKINNNRIKIRYIPIGLKKILIFLLKTFTKEKTYAPVEFFLTVLSTDFIAPKFGKTTLKEFFLNLQKKTI